MKKKRPASQATRQSGKTAVPRPTNLPAWKKLLFSALACLLCLVALELLLGLAGVRPIRFETDPYVGFSSRIPLFVKDATSADAGVVITAPNKRRIFNTQRFSAQKPPGTFRIFCMGGSTTYGHPYEDSTSFAGWLRAMLPKADPSRRWEVINCGGVSYASYREAVLMEELTQYQPDLFIILTGHNEFLEHRTYGEILAKPESLRDVGALLSRTRLHAAIKGLSGKLQTSGQPAGTNSNILPTEVETMLERVVGPQAYHRDDQWKKGVLDHFRFNLTRMTGIAAAAGAKIIFINPAGDIRSSAPFKSEHRAGLTEADLARWQAQVQKVRQLAAASRWTEALETLRAAAAIDDQFAELHYLQGQVHWRMEQFAEARAAFTRAREEDVCPLRAITPMFDSIADVAKTRGASVVDFEKLLNDRATNGIPGDDWFLDHVHPTIEGHRQLALALLETLSGMGVAKFASSWNEAATLAVKREVESTLTPEKHGTALLTLSKVLAWAGKHEEAFRVALRAIPLAPNNAAIHYEAGKNASYLERNDEAAKHLETALRLNPGFVEARTLLGNLLGQRGQNDEALRQCRAALASRPNDPQLHSNLGSLLALQGQWEQAIASFKEAIRLDPTYAEAHSNLAWVYKDSRRYDDALRHFRECLRLKPGLPSPSIGLAWLLATHPDPARRNPAEAIPLAEKLVAQSGYQNWMSLDALAAAYAASGRFDKAATAARKALPLVQSDSPGDVTAVEARLQSYLNRQPFTEPAALSEAR